VSDENKPIEPEIVSSLPNEIPGTGEDDPMRTLGLRRTKFYINRMLRGMPAGELVNLIKEQTQLVILLLGEQVLKFVEELDLEQDLGRRAALQERITQSIEHASRMAKEKTALLDAFGYDPHRITEDADGNPIVLPKKTQISSEQFESMFMGKLNPFEKAETIISDVVKERLANPPDKDSVN